MRLENIAHDRLSSRVAAMIKKEIVRGRLKPGDRLPTEQKLSEHLGISRNAVREGLAQLRQEGLVRSRQGVGAFVADPTSSATLKLDPGTLSGTGDYRSLFELRRILETGAAELAAQSWQDDDLALIEEAFDGMRKCGIWSEDGVDHDIAFHRALAGATNNGFLLLFIAFVDDLLKASIRSAREIVPQPDLQEVTIAEHAAILEALRARDPAAAREAMLNHLANAAARLGL
ncbi:MAG: FadR/GntR family transcriptional regulator [Acuticoccus sp.]